MITVQIRGRLISLRLLNNLPGHVGLLIINDGIKNNVKAEDVVNSKEDAECDPQLTE